MLSQRRIRFLAVTAVVVILVYLYYSGEGRSVQNQEFYRSTVAAINAHKTQKNAENAKGPAADLSHKHKEHVGAEEYVVGDWEQPAIPKAPVGSYAAQDTEEIPIAGRRVMTVPKDRGDAVSDAAVEAAQEPQQETKHETQEEPQVDGHQEAKTELNVILKRSPIIIFSKSYCPYSKKAKSILLGRYSIVPAPFVVELDQHPLGHQLQALLAENTGRRTVPNVLVNGKSIGGGDDIAAMDEHDELTSTLRNMGGKWLQQVSRNEGESTN